jgi:2,3-bisphosphoglycerate-independent phosphoglycerate mutase
LVPIVFEKESVKEYISHIKVKEEAINLLKDKDLDALFLHFDDVDAEGHSTGFSLKIQYIWKQLKELILMLGKCCLL